MADASDAPGGALEARYANQFQVGHNEFEFVFDFAQYHAHGGATAAASPQLPIVRIVMAPPFALALLNTLQQAVAEHEQLHGTIDHA